MHEHRWLSRPARPGTRLGGSLRFAVVASLVLGSLGVGLSSVLSAAPPAAETKWTLMQAVESAWATHPTLRAARAAQESARSQVGIAKANWLPQLALHASATGFEKPMLVYPIHGFTAEDIPPFARSIYAGTLGLDFTLFDGGARGSRIGEARAQERAASAQVETATQDLTQQVVFAYLQVLGQQQLLQAHDRRLAALRAELSRVEQILDTGRAARVDLLRAQAELHRAEAERVERAAALELSELELARLVGSGETSLPAQRLLPVSLTDSLVPSRDSLIAAAQRANSELQAAQSTLEAARSHGRLARAQRWPRLDLFARGQAWSDGDTEHTAEWNAGVELDYPLFTGGARRQRIAAADAAVRNAEARVHGLQLEIQRRIDGARSDALEARARTASLRSAVARFAEVQRIRVLALDTGTGTQTDYLDAEADLLDAQARLIDARHREIASRTALAWHSGQLDVEWLRRNLENR